MRLVLIAAVVLVLPPAASASAQKEEDVVRWTASAPAAPIKPGGTAAIELRAEIDGSWHMYALTQLEGGPPPLAIAPARASAVQHLPARQRRSCQSR